RTGLQQEDARAVRTQPVGQYAAGRAGADDHVIRPQVVRACAHCSSRRRDGVRLEPCRQEAHPCLPRGGTDTLPSRIASKGRASVAVQSKNQNWLAQLDEEVVEPEIPICDPHHHLWDLRKGAVQERYLLDEILADVSGGHNIVSTVFIE